MARPVGVHTVAPVGRPTAHQQSAALLAHLVKAMAAGNQFTPPADIRSLRLDAPALSALVRRAALESHIADSKTEQQVQNVLQDVLSRVSPQHLERLISVLQESEQPAINHDATYGEAVSLGDAGSSRAATRSDPGFRDVWVHGANAQTPPSDEDANGNDRSAAAEEPDGWSYHAREPGEWQRPRMPPPAMPDLSPVVAWHPVVVAVAVVLALLLPALLLLNH